MNPELLNQFIEAAKRVPGWLVYRIETEEIPDLIAMLEVDTYPHPIGIGKQINIDGNWLITRAIEEALEAWDKANSNAGFEISSPWLGHPDWDYLSWQGDKELFRGKAPTRLEAAMRALIACYGEEAS